MAGRVGHCLSGIAAVALASLLAGCGEEPVPLQPAFEPTIRTLLAAHCVRCHGAGGTLNPDPEVLMGHDVPGLAYLDRYNDSGDCTVDPATMAVGLSCKRGALGMVALIEHYVQQTTGATAMPPAPAPRLTDWELATLLRWTADPRP